jgi:putative ABC transport system permease protein
MYTTAALQNTWQDTIYAGRGMRKNPIFAATAILTLALGIGGNTAMFTVIRAVLLKPLDYREPDRLVSILGDATPARFKELEANARSFSGIAAFTPPENLTLAGGMEPEVLSGVQVSAGFLEILGVHPILGRGFLPAEDSPGGAHVAMISFELWNRRFNRDGQIAGKTVILAATPSTIIGVLPPHFQFPSKGLDVWLTRPSEWDLMPAKSRQLSPFLTLFGRLKPQVSLAQANAEMAVLHRRYAAAHPAMLDAKAKSPLELALLKDQLVSDVRTMLWMLFGAVSFVLLITCANVASLLLARAMSRNREFVIRSALGASRARLIGQLLSESLLLSMAGGALGMLLAAWSLRAIPLMTAFDLPRASEIRPDLVVLGFAVLLSIGTGTLFGLAPSLGASRPDLVNVLRGGGQAANKATHGRIGLGTRGLLVTGQVALSVVLLIGAALLMESLAYLRGVKVGFNPANLLTLRVSLPLTRYDTDQKRAAFFQGLVERVALAPGVRSATAAMFLPMTGFVGSPVQDAGKPPLKLNERPIATLLIVAPAYFETLKIPMRRGRDFNARDRKEAERVAIIDEATARRFWPEYPSGLDPIGQQLLIGGVNAKPARIVGIVAQVHQNLQNSAWPETVYEPFAQEPQPFAMLAIRTAGAPLGLVNTVRDLVRVLDRDQPISDFRTMEDLLDLEVGQRRLIVVLLASFAGVALLLALIGVYGVISYSVTQRIQELGIRSALGAQQSDLLLLVMGQGFGLTIAGIGIGIVGALALTRLLMGMLFQVKATDPATYLGVGLLFVVVGLAASYVPARRVTRIDPLEALRI